MSKLTYKPLGARLLVEPIITTLSLEERARNAGLEIVVEQDNVPAPTQGKVIALGPDPFLREQIKENDIVFFSRYAGNEVVLAGITYRQLELSEVTGVMQEEIKTSSEPEATQVERT